MSYRVVQWATGNMGKACLKAVISHQDLELVGVRVYSDSKVGIDAGEIAGGDAVGVTSTNRMDDILATSADVVIHAARLQPPYTHHNEDICRLLASGKNVISINGHTFPQHWGEEYVAGIEEACKAGNSTFFGTGLNPGLVSEKLLATCTGICSRIDSITIEETLQCNLLDGSEYVFDILGFGSEIGSINPNDPDWGPGGMMNGLFMEVVHELVDRMGFCLDRIDIDHSMKPASKDIVIPAGTIRQGTNAHTRWCWHGVVDGRRLFTLVINWVMETCHLDKPEFNLWDVSIKGVPSLDMAINMSVPESYLEAGLSEEHATEVSVALGVAGSVVNCIPMVCSATPGILRVPVANHFQRRLLIE